MQQLENVVMHAVNAIEHADKRKPLVGLILGSGLGGYSETLEHKTYVDFCDIKGFPTSHVEGHQNRFVIGEHHGMPVIAMQGRFHYYEGYSIQEMTLGVRAMQCIGAKYLLLTNAAGGVNTSFAPGTLMLINDHINFSGMNPLIGKNWDAFGPRFPDMSNVYDKALRMALKSAALSHGLTLEEGVYMMFSGPSYETPAEIRMARTLGADAVGMSTVPEAIAAAHCGMRTLGISLITNAAAGVTEAKLSHEEVQAVAKEAKERFTELVNIALEEVLLV